MRLELSVELSGAADSGCVMDILREAMRHGTVTQADVVVNVKQRDGTLVSHERISQLFALDLLKPSEGC